MKTMLEYNSISEQEALQKIYDFLRMELLTSPECSFINGEAFLGDSVTFGDQYNNSPGSLSALKDALKNVKWEVCLCVAGTELDDSRRVVMTYSKELKKINVHFPMAQSYLTTNEEKIRDRIEKAVSKVGV